MSGEPRVADMNISDEHFIVEAKTSMKQVAEILLEDHKAAILVRDRKEGRIISALNAADLIGIVASGGKPGSIKAIDIGREDLIYLPATMMLSEAISIMRERTPEAVIIVDDAGDPVGYFSPDDYGEAVSKIDQHRKRLEAVQHSVDNTPGPSNDLLDALEEDNDAEDEEEVELPEDPFSSMGDDDEAIDDDDQSADGEAESSDDSGFEEVDYESMSDAERLMSSMRSRTRGEVNDLEEQFVQSEPEDDLEDPEDDEQALEDIGGHLQVEHSGIETDDRGGFSVDDILNDTPEQEAGPAPAEPTRKVKGPPKRPHRARQGAAATIPLASKLPGSLGTRAPSMSP